MRAKSSIRRLSPSRKVYQRLIRFTPFRIVIALFAVYIYLETTKIQQALTLDSALNDRPQLAQPRERIFIASVQWNTEYLLRTHLTKALLDLSQALGPQNVFVNIYESGSLDNSKGALKDLDRLLWQQGAARRITTSNDTHLSEINQKPIGPGWIDTPKGKKRRRIPYLSRLRNKNLDVLRELDRQGIKFDKILFVNDVVFNTKDVLELLNTNNGEYAAACGLDFQKGPGYYDTFALRDSDGHETVSQYWPYFRSSTSRHAMYSNAAVPVAACWNGIVAMPAAPFLAKKHAERSQQSVLSDPEYQIEPLQFRGVPDSLAVHHVEASECCLVHADNPFTERHGVFVNPRVRVGYNAKAYQRVHPAAKNTPWVSKWEIVSGLWGNRIRRLLWSPAWKEWTIHKRVRAWMRAETGRQEAGAFCLVNEMQILIANGWAHV